MFKDILIKIAVGKMGWLLKLVTSLLAGFILPFIMNTLGLSLPPEKQAEVVAAIAGGVYILLQAAVIKLSLTGNERVQAELQKIDPSLAQDRWVGDVTIKALEGAVRQSTDVVRRTRPELFDNDAPKATPVGRKK